VIRIAGSHQDHRGAQIQRLDGGRIQHTGEVALEVGHHRLGAGIDHIAGGARRIQPLRRRPGRHLHADAGMQFVESRGRGMHRRSGAAGTEHAHHRGSHDAAAEQDQAQQQQ